MSHDYRRWTAGSPTATWSTSRLSGAPIDIPAVQGQRKAPGALLPALSSAKILAASTNGPPTKDPLASPAVLRNSAASQAAGRR